MAIAAIVGPRMPKTPAYTGGLRFHVDPRGLSADLAAGHLGLKVPEPTSRSNGSNTVTAPPADRRSVPS